MSVPCAAVGPETIVKLAMLPSISVPASGITTATPSSVGVALVAAVATGASLIFTIAGMVTLAVAAEGVPLLSVTLNTTGVTAPK